MYVKENDLAHGEFGKWLESIGMAHQHANRFMRITDELDAKYTTSCNSVRMEIRLRIRNRTAGNIRNRFRKYDAGVGNATTSSVLSSGAKCSTSNDKRICVNVENVRTSERNE